MTLIASTVKSSTAVIIVLSIAIVCESIFLASTSSTGIADPFRYCWEFDPTVDVTPYELAVVIKIFGGGGGVGAPLRHYSKSPAYLWSKPPATDDDGFVTRQFQRAEWCDK